MFKYSKSVSHVFLFYFGPTPKTIPCSTRYAYKALTVSEFSDSQGPNNHHHPPPPLHFFFIQNTIDVLSRVANVRRSHVVNDTEHMKIDETVESERRYRLFSDYFYDIPETALFTITDYSSC